MINLLIVDDEEEIGDYLTEIVKEMGIQDVKTVLTGEEAMELISRREWKIALVDLRLATAISGLDVIRAIRQRWPHTRVIAMTGYVDVDLRQKAEGLGIDALVEKPDGLHPNLITDKIKSVLSQVK